MVQALATTSLVAFAVPFRLLHLSFPWSLSFPLELAQGSVLKNFTWSEEKEKKESASSEWITEDPSDAQILMHLFCTFMVRPLKSLFPEEDSFLSVG